MNHRLIRFLFIRRFSPTLFERVGRLFSSFTLFERVTFGLVFLVMAGAALFLAARVHALYLTEVPRRDGSLIEGIIGSPRFINPLLATTDADRDLSSLVYAGLLAVEPDGTLTPELAESYEIVDGGISYVFTLRDDAIFHDGTPITADDVVFTIEMAKDPNVKSPRFATWNDVTVEKIDERTVRFSPKNIYAPFLHNLTIGILPRAPWKNITADQFAFSTLNIEPIGAGPYRIEKIGRDKTGIPTTFTLRSFSGYVRGEPYIERLELRFYPNEDDLLLAFDHGEIEAMSAISPKSAAALASENSTIIKTPLLRVFGIFFNGNNTEALSYKEVRSALSLAVPREEIVETVLFGFGSENNRPFPPGLIPSKESSTTPDTDEKNPIEAAHTLLKKNGWTQSTTTGTYEKKLKSGTTVSLSFSLVVPNSEELKKVASILVEVWRTVGANVTVSVYEQGDLQQNVIRPRKYDALLFGHIIGRDRDLYPFWHSSQRSDPGYNIAVYTNVQADKLLEDARRENDEDIRNKTYVLFEEALLTDIPAIFLYSPDFIYVLPDQVKNVALGSIAVPAERFMNIHEWYVKTDHIFSPLADILPR